jgi:hypothetical protein
MMRNPPFRGGPAGGGDFLTKQGAEKLAAMIRAAWAQAGHKVEVELVPSGQAILEAKQIWAVRMPSLHNGLPR